MHEVRDSTEGHGLSVSEGAPQAQCILWYLSTDDRRFRPAEQIIGQLSRLVPLAVTATVDRTSGE